MELSGGEMNYFATLDWFPFQRERVVFENKKEAYKWVFPKAVFALYLS